MPKAGSSVNSGTQKLWPKSELPSIDKLSSFSYPTIRVFCKKYLPEISLKQKRDILQEELRRFLENQLKMHENNDNKIYTMNNATPIVKSDSKKHSRVNSAISSTTESDNENENVPTSGLTEDNNNKQQVDLPIPPVATVIAAVPVANTTAEEIDKYVMEVAEDVAAKEQLADDYGVEISVIDEDEDKNTNKNELQFVQDNNAVCENENENENENINSKLNEKENDPTQNKENDNDDNKLNNNDDVEDEEIDSLNIDVVPFNTTNNDENSKNQSYETQLKIQQAEIKTQELFPKTLVNKYPLFADPTISSQAKLLIKIIISEADKIRKTIRTEISHQIVSLSRKLDSQMMLFSPKVRSCRISELDLLNDKEKDVNIKVFDEIKNKTNEANATIRNIISRTISMPNQNSKPSHPKVSTIFQ